MGVLDVCCFCAFLSAQFVVLLVPLIVLVCRGACVCVCCCCSPELCVGVGAWLVCLCVLRLACDVCVCVVLVLCVVVHMFVDCVMLRYVVYVAGCVLHYLSSVVCL